MMDILVVVLALSVLSICKCITDLSKRIDELEKKIDYIQYQTEDVLCNIRLLSEMKNENEKD